MTIIVCINFLTGLQSRVRHSTLTSRFDKSGFLRTKQKRRTIQTKTGSHYIYIRKWENIFKKLTRTLYNSIKRIRSICRFPLTLILTYVKKKYHFLLLFLKILFYWEKCLLQTPIPFFWSVTSLCAISYICLPLTLIPLKIKCIPCI